MTTVASSGLPGGFLQCVVFDGAILVLGATDEAGASIVEPVDAPLWSESASRSLVPWRITPSDTLERWRLNGYRNLEGVDLGVAPSLEPPMTKICVFFEGISSLALVVDNTSAFRTYDSTVLLNEPTHRAAAERESALANRLIVMIGAGSLGSHMARAFADWGFGFLAIVDKDWLEAKNLTLHTCGPSWVGAAKAKAVAKDLERLYGIRAVGQRYDVCTEAEATRDLIESADLVVVAVDDARTRAWTNHTSVRLGVPTLFSALYRGGTIGESMLVRPGGPCLNCSRLVLPIDPDTQNTPTPSSYRSGLLNSIYAMTALSAGMAVSALAPEIEAAGALPHPLALWSPIAQDDFDDPYRFRLPNQVNWVPLPTMRSCSVCQGGSPVDSDHERTRMRARLGLEE